MGLIAYAERHAPPGRIGDIVPGAAAVVDDAVEGFDLKIRFESQSPPHTVTRTAERFALTPFAILSPVVV